MANNTTEPLRTLEQIQAVRKVLKTQRDRTLFTVAINTGYRGGDLLALTIGDAKKALVTGRLTIRQQKGEDIRTVQLSRSTLDEIRALILERPSALNPEPLFESAKPGTALSIQSYSRLFKHWCTKAGLVGEYASHSGRKTFGYVNSRVYNVPMDQISQSYGHSSSSVTKAYMGFTTEELAPLSMRDL